MTTQSLEKKTPQVSYHLSADTGLTIHTKRAQSLCEGGWDYRQMGLFQFASVMMIINHAHDQDDPYADWHLEKIEKELTEIKQTIETKIADYEQKIHNWRGLEISIFGSRKPLKLILNFSTRWGYLAGNVVGQLDYLLRQAYTFRKLGILPESDAEANQLFWQFKTALAQCRQWRYTGVTRQDIRQKNQIADRARSMLGKIPSRFLNKSEK